MPSTDSGSPAFGITRIGSEVHSLSSLTRGIICLGPKPQLNPIASTLSPSSIATALLTSPPVRSLPDSSKIIEVIIGKSEFSLTAITAALSSYISLIVSIIATSEPSLPALTTSAKSSTALSNSRSPIGFKSLPVGPISSATYLPAFLASATPAFTSSSTLSYLSELAPKVLAVINSAPASAYPL